MTKQERLQKAEAEYQAHFENNRDANGDTTCPHCKRAIFDVTAPACYIAVALSRKVMELRRKSH